MALSPYINRFLSADTIVPGYTNPQNLNRYSYVTNNPLRYTDPTGHMLWDGEGGGGKKGCSDPKYCRDGKPKPAEELKKMLNEKKKLDSKKDDLLVQRHECLVGCHWPGPNEASYEALTDFFDFDNMARDVWDTLQSPLSGVGPGFVFCSSGKCDPNVVDGVTDIVSRVPEFIKFINEGYNPPPTIQPTPFLSPTVEPTATLSITATPTITLTSTLTVTPSLTPTFPALTPTSASTPVYWIP